MWRPQEYANTSHGASIGCLHDDRLALAVSHCAIRELGDPARCKRLARALRAVENAVTISRVCVRQSAGDAQAMKDMARPRVSSRLMWTVFGDTGEREAACARCAYLSARGTGQAAQSLRWPLECHGERWRES